MKTTMYAGAFLAVAVLVMTFSIISDGLFHSEVPEQFGYEIAEAEGSAAPAASGPAEIPSIAPMLASADAAAGENVFKKCAACHNIVDGGANKVGPNLWNVIGAKPGAVDGFNYSSALVAYGEEQTAWDFENLNRFLVKPRDEVSGTTMGFAGLKKPEDRANVLAYINQQSSAPKEYPEPVAAAPAAEEGAQVDSEATTEEAPATE